MVSQSPFTPTTDLPPQSPEKLVPEQVHLKNEDGQLVLRLPSPVQGALPPWEDLLLQLKQRLESSERFWQPHSALQLQSGDRLLDSRQLQALVETLGEAQLLLKRVITSRRQTAMAAITLGCSVDQLTDMEYLNQSIPTPGQPLASPLYLQTTVRSGIDIRHPGTIMILGDTNPGSALIADGDIVVWGRLRGLAHAGAGGNRQCRIMALQMQPTQLRIADLVARPPDSATTQYGPEVAYIGDNQGIRIALAEDFMRQQLTPRGLGFDP
ncbi:MAG: septum site-determining protein MinC [Cyanobacteria bacterium REEB459]|nr:septum site-determining protein MinC [Cyanobacteria bacterium REEB459]